MKLSYTVGYVTLPYHSRQMCYRLVLRPPESPMCILNLTVILLKPLMANQTSRVWTSVPVLVRLDLSTALRSFPLSFYRGYTTGHQRIVLKQYCQAQTTCTLHCRVLPPGDLNGIILALQQFCCK